MTATLDSLIALVEERGWEIVLIGPSRSLGADTWSAKISEPPHKRAIGYATAESALAAVTQAIRQAGRATGGA